ncbi:Metal homeostasis factor ATX2 [Nakaseomyces bracarensis]|uniref:Metal homeostasis factor ATX2 n=1 Tax=Nakaseomyces bracarensis TaxID=273131 RepID=A0ABR4P093_9SACH
MGTSFFTIVLLAVLLLLVTFAIGCLPFYYVGNSHEKFLRTFSQFGVGMLLGTSFMLVIPEGIESCVEKGGNVGLDLLIGFLGVFLLDKLVHKISSRNNNDHSNSIDNDSMYYGFKDSLRLCLKDLFTNPRIIITRILRNNVIFAFVIHGISDGVALGTTVNNESLLIIVFIAIIIHKIPAVLSLSALMVTKQGLPLNECMTNLFMFSLSTPLGYIILSLFNLKQSDIMDYISSNLLLMSGGSLLYASFTAFGDDPHLVHEKDINLENDYSMDPLSEGPLSTGDITLSAETDNKSLLDHDESLYIVIGVLIPTVISFIVRD